MDQDDTACDRDCMHCWPVTLASHVNRKRTNERDKRSKHRSSYNRVHVTSDEKRLESRRDRAHRRDALAKDAESLPLRDVPAMRWNVWNWD